MARCFVVLFVDTIGDTRLLELKEEAVDLNYQICFI